jgi:peptidoglycan hydrolase-like protein with peptidoglycan-binding domain
MAEPTLKRGSKGQAVKDLQEALNEGGIGGFSVAVDGIFGKKTEDLVKVYQEVFGVDVDGIVGPVTWRFIDEFDHTEPLLKKGSKGLAVRRLQNRLKLAGFAVSEVDGRFGPKTEAAVKTLQKQAGLAVDGHVGPKTWAVVDALEVEGERR